MLTRCFATWPKKETVSSFRYSEIIRCKKSNRKYLFRRTTDPLVHHGRHFGRSIHALCNVHALINNGIIRMGERAEEPEESFTTQ